MNGLQSHIGRDPRIRPSEARPLTNREKSLGGQYLKFIQLYNGPKLLLCGHLVALESFWSIYGPYFKTSR